MPNHSKSAEARHPSRKKKRHSTAERCVADVLSRRQRELGDTVYLYVLKDPSSDKYSFPFPSVNDNVALRAQKELSPCSNLYKVGSFCRSTGEMKQCRKTIVLDIMSLNDNKVK